MPHALEPDLAFLFDEGSGTTTVDEIEGLTGTLTGGCTFGRLGIDIVAATGGYVGAPRASDSPFLGAISLVWYGILDATDSFRCLMTKTSGNGSTLNPFDFYVQTGQPRLVRANTDLRGWITTAAPISPGNRYQIAVVAPSVIQTSPVFYVDGADAGTTASSGGGSGAPTGAGGDIRIGRRVDGGTQIDGTVEAAFFYGRALTAQDISDLYDDPLVWVGGGGLSSVMRSGVFRSPIFGGRLIR